MKNLFCSILILDLLLGHFAIGQDFHWASNIGSTLLEQGENVTVDKYGNTYITGDFGYRSTPTTWGGYYYESTSSLFIKGDILMNNGYDNLFFIKYDPYGNLIWAKSIGGFNDHDFPEIAGVVTYDSISDCIYLSGCCTGDVSFGSITLSCSNSDVFLAKFNLNGTCTWAKSFTGFGIDYVLAQCTDREGNVYLTGLNSDVMSIQSIIVNRGGFVAKFDSTGTCLWAKNEFIPHLSYGYDVIPQSITVFNSNILVGGYSEINSVQIDTITLTDTNNSYPFSSGVLAKFDNHGSVKWAKYTGGPSSMINATVVDLTGNIYIAGSFFKTCRFDTIVIDSLLHDVMFLVKCDTSGSAIWLSRPMKSDACIAEDLKTDKFGNCYITGQFHDNISFGQNLFMDTGNTWDSFIVKYSHDGILDWAKHITDGIANTIAINYDGSMVAVAGEFWPNVNFDSVTFLDTYGSVDVFIAKYDFLSGVETKENRPLKIYPNPTSRECNIRLPDDFVKGKEVTLSLFNQIGMNVFQKNLEVNDGMAKIELDPVSNGFYLVSITNGQKCHYGKIIKE